MRFSHGVATRVRNWSVLLVFVITMIRLMYHEVAQGINKKREGTSKGVNVQFMW